MDNNRKYGLSETDINNVIEVLRANQKVKKIVLFGSRAKGNFKEGSDIDIALIGNDLRLNDILDFSLEIDKLFLPYKFDLIIFGRIKEKELVEHINRVGIVLFERV